MSAWRLYIHDSEHVWFAPDMRTVRKPLNGLQGPDEINDEEAARVLGLQSIDLAQLYARLKLPRVARGRWSRTALLAWCALNDPFRDVRALADETGAEK